MGVKQVTYLWVGKMGINDLKKENVIVAYDYHKLIRIYINPKDFRKNTKDQWTFACDKYITVMPPNWDFEVEIHDDPHPDTGEIRDTIIHEDDWYTLKGVPKEVLGNTFKGIFH